MAARVCSLGALVLLCALSSAELYDGEDAVTDLTAKQFRKQVLASDKPWLVEFYAPWCGYCKKLAPDWIAASKRVSKSFSGKFFMAAVNADEHKQLAQEYGITGFPAVKFFGPDKDDKPEDFGGRDEDAIVSFVEEKVGNLAPPAESKLAPSMEYTKLWTFLYNDPLPSVLLLTNGKKGAAPGWFSTVATYYKSGKKKSVQFAYISGRDEGRTAKRLGIETGGSSSSSSSSNDDKKKTSKSSDDEDDEEEEEESGGGSNGDGDNADTPELVVVLPPKKKSDKGKGRFVRFSAHADSDGGLGQQSTIQLRKDVRMFIDQVVEGKHEKHEEKMPSLPEPSRPRKIAPTELTELTPDNTDSYCYNQRDKKMCVVVMVAEEADGSVGELPVLEKVAKKYRNDPFVFAYVKAKEQQNFVEGFGLAPFSQDEHLPHVACIKTGRRKRFALWQPKKGKPLTAKRLASFLDRVIGGNERFKAPTADALPELEASWEKLVDDE